MVHKWVRLRRGSRGWRELRLLLLDVRRGVQHISLPHLLSLIFVRQVCPSSLQDDVLGVHQVRVINLLWSSLAEIIKVLLVLVKLTHHVVCGDLFLIPEEVLILFENIGVLINPRDLSLPSLVLGHDAWKGGGLPPKVLLVPEHPTLRSIVSVCVAQ